LSLLSSLASCTMSCSTCCGLHLPCGLPASPLRLAPPYRTPRVAAAAPSPCVTCTAASPRSLPLRPPPSPCECSKPCKVAYRWTEKGSKVRVSKRSGNVIPYPKLEERYTPPLRPTEPGAYVRLVLRVVLVWWGGEATRAPAFERGQRRRSAAVRHRIAAAAAAGCMMCGRSSPCVSVRQSPESALSAAISGHLDACPWQAPHAHAHACSSCAPSHTTLSHASHRHTAPPSLPASPLRCPPCPPPPPPSSSLSLFPPLPRRRARHGSEARGAADLRAASAPARLPLARALHRRRGARGPRCGGATCGQRGERVHLHAPHTR